MKKLINAAVVVCVTIVLIYGCDSTNNPVSQSESDRSTGILGSVTDEPAVLINNYNVKLTGYNFSNGKTTFSYSVSHNNGPSSNNFYLQIPDCAVDDFNSDLLDITPDGPIRYPYFDKHSETTGVYWNSSLSRGTSHFSLTFSGDVPVGTIAATVESGNRNGTGSVPGPCNGYIEEVKMIEISGNVFVDIVDENGGNRFKDTFETGIYNVVVQLKAGSESVDIKNTDVTGNFSFLVPAGTYTILIPETIAGVQFNVKFFETYNFAGFEDDFDAADPSLLISPTDDFSIDFPFNADPDALIEAFRAQTILTNTKDVMFWRQMIRAAATNSQGNFEVPKNDIYEYLNKIEKNDFFKTINVNLLPDVPFQFKGNNNRQRAADALEYMFNPSPEKTEEELFLQALLVAQLNIVSGKYGVGGFELGAGESCVGGDVVEKDGKSYCTANIEEFHLALLAYGEGLAASFLSPTVAQKFSTTSISSTLSSATTVFTTFNRTGSGGLN